jgi:hypothetical protein
MIFAAETFLISDAALRCQSLDSLEVAADVQLETAWFLAIF